MQKNWTNINEQSKKTTEFHWNQSSNRIFPHK